MEHLEAQSYIMPFIDGKIPSDKQDGFVLHMKNCKKCHEELEIYYTLMVGMRQLDNNQDLSADFNKDLERELNRLSSRAKNKLRVKISAFSISLTAFLVVGSFLYAGAIAKIYNFEQNTKKSNQGKYYFSTSLGNQLLVNGIDHMKVSEEIENEKKITGFERIKGFKQLEEDLDKILDTGEELLYDEVIID